MNDKNFRIRTSIFRISLIFKFIKLKFIPKYLRKFREENSGQEGKEAN